MSNRERERERWGWGEESRIESAGEAVWTSACVPSLSFSLPFHVRSLSLLLLSSSALPLFSLECHWPEVWLVMAFQRV